ncbi:MAG: ATP-binding protein [Gammaproteobacteria bacterium]|nr:ATP-binding protein [Gammaproteobacteria bacterium]
MADSRLIRHRITLFFLTLFVSALLLSIFLLHRAAEDAEFFANWYSWLFTFNGICLVALIGLIGNSFFQLLRQIRNQEVGARLTTKLAATLIVLAVLPAGFMYVFSLSFLQKGVDSWFDNKVETTLNEAMSLSRNALDERVNHVRSRISDLSTSMQRNTQSSIRDNFLQHLDQTNHGFEQLQLFTHDGNAVFFSDKDQPSNLDQAIRDSISAKKPFIVLEPGENNRIIIRAASQLIDRNSGATFYIYGIYPITDDMGVLAQRVYDAFSHYRGLIYIREPLKNSFVLTLSLALLQALLTAIWAAFYFAQKLVEPIRILAQGTRAVAVGNYQQQLPEISHDELGLLVKSFNDMTRRIDLSQREALTSQIRAETQRLYLETVLQNLSSGVITLDAQGNLHTCNTAASQILKCDLESQLGQPASNIARQNTPLAQLLQRLGHYLNQQEITWSEEINLILDEQMHNLICRGTRLPSNEQLPGGYVLVFDDVTQLIKAQKESAWSDVARRLAHEIKNPLTPIQLSAERLLHKYQNKLEGEDADVLQKATSTIINQVESMKNMVRAFSDYAKPPKAEMQKLSLNQLILDIAELYQNHDNSTLRLSLGKQPMWMLGDADRLRQLLHNLIKNAIEANGKSGGELVYISTRLDTDEAPHIELAIEDQGPGIDVDMLNIMFEPYVTSKTKGTGLGLAVAQKIVEEHSGTISAKNLRKQGAAFVIHFPISPTIETGTTT